MGWQERVLRGHSVVVLSVAFSRDGKWIVSGSEDTLVKIWEAETGAEVCGHGWTLHLVNHGFCLVYRESLLITRPA